MWRSPGFYIIHLYIARKCLFTFKLNELVPISQQRCARWPSFSLFLAHICSQRSSIIRLVLWRQKKERERERVTLSSIPFWFIKIRDQLSISLLIIKRRKKYCRSLQFSLNIFFTEQGNFDIFKLSRENVSN